MSALENAPLQVTLHEGTDSRLAQLHAQCADAKAAADEAAKQLKVITDGIKAELNTIAPEERRILLTGAGGPTLRLTYVESWRIDAKKLKAEDPNTYVRYATKSGSWQLRAETAGGA